MKAHTRHTNGFKRQPLYFGALAVLVLTLSAGCPPEGAQDVPGAIPHGDQFAPIRPGDWVFAFYFLNDFGLYSGVFELGGVHLDDDGTAREYFFDGETIPAQQWSVVNGVFQLNHDSDTFLCAGEVKNNEYIEGSFSDSADGSSGLFTARFVAENLDPDPTADAPQLRTGHWLYARYVHIDDHIPISIDDYSFPMTTNIEVDLVHNADGIVKLIRDNGDLAPTDFVWSQNERRFRMEFHEPVEPNEVMYEGEVLTSGLIAGTFTSEADDYDGTFIAYFVPTEHVINPDSDSGPVIGF